MIRRVYIDGYKSLRSVEIDGLENLVVVFGANASGKSNLLDALDLLARLAREDTLLQAFQRHRGSRATRPLPVKHFFCQGDDRPMRMTFEVDLSLQRSLVKRLNAELEQREAREGVRHTYTRVQYTELRYHLEIRYDVEARALEVVRETLTPLTTKGRVHEAVVPFIREEDGVLWVKLERQSHPRTFPLPRTRTLLSEIGDLVNHPHLVATARELASVSVYYIEPTRMRSEINDVDARNPGPNGQTLPAFYHWLRRSHPIRFKNLEQSLARLVPGFEGVAVREGTEGFLELWVREAGRGEFPAALLSEGTLRLLCFLGILATPEPPAVVGYEEPENGVHPGRLDEILEMVIEAASRGETQLFLTTHSPEVLDKLHHHSCIRVERAAGHSTYERLSDIPLQRYMQRSAALGAVRPPSAGQRLVRGDLG